MNTVYAYEFEREMIRQVISLMKEKGLNYSTLAQSAFGPGQKSIDRLKQMRMPRKETGKPQSVTVSDAVLLASVLGMDAATLCFRVAQVLELQRKSEAKSLPLSGEQRALSAADGSATYEARKG